MLRVATLNATGLGRHECSLTALGAQDAHVLCITETMKARAAEVTTHSRHDIELSGFASTSDATANNAEDDTHRNENLGKQRKYRPRGGVRLLSDEAHPLRYRAHYTTKNIQALVASVPGGVTVVGLYVSPTTSQAQFGTLLGWLSGHTRGTSVILGDANARHKNWDRQRYLAGMACNRGKALETWATLSLIHI